MRKAIIALFIINAFLVAAVVWLLMDTGASGTDAAEAIPDEVVTEPVVPDSMISSSLPPDARIAYFFMDSIERRFQMVKDREEVFEQESIRLEKRIKAEAKRSQRRYEELMSKDRTYSTQAEMEADEAELQGLMGKMQNMQAESEQELARLEVNMLQEITDAITDYLAAYNEKQGLDFIYSIQPGGQIWVGNEGLDITEEVIVGLNAEYMASKGK